VPIGYSQMAIWAGRPIPGALALLHFGERARVVRSQQPDGGVAHSRGGVTILARGSILRRGSRNPLAGPKRSLATLAIAKVRLVLSMAGSAHPDGTDAAREAREFSGSLSAAPGFLGA